MKKLKRFSTRVLNIGSSIWGLPWVIYEKLTLDTSGCLTFLNEWFFWTLMFVVAIWPFALAGMFITMFGLLLKAFLIPVYISDIVKCSKAKKQGIDLRAVWRAEEEERIRLKAEWKAEKKHAHFLRKIAREERKAAIERGENPPPLPKWERIPDPTKVKKPKKVKEAKPKKVKEAKPKSTKEATRAVPAEAIQEPSIVIQEPKTNETSKSKSSISLVKSQVERSESVDVVLLDKVEREKISLRKSLDKTNLEKEKVLLEYKNEIARLNAELEKHNKEAEKAAIIAEKKRIAEEKRKEKEARLLEKAEKTKRLLEIKEKRSAREREAYKAPTRINTIMQVSHVAIVFFTLLIAFVLYTISFSTMEGANINIIAGLFGGVIITAIMLIPTYIPVIVSSISFLASVKRIKLVKALRIVAIMLYLVLALLSALMCLVMIIAGDIVLTFVFVTYILFSITVIAIIVVSFFTSLKKAKAISIELEKEFREEENEASLEEEVQA